MERAEGRRGGGVEGVEGWRGGEVEGVEGVEECSGCRVR